MGNTYSFEKLKAPLLGKFKLKAGVQPTKTYEFKGAFNKEGIKY